MIYSQFDQFLREVLKLPMTVFEGPSLATLSSPQEPAFHKRFEMTFKILSYSFKLSDTTIQTLFFLLVFKLIIIQQVCIKLIKSDTKYIHNITKYFFFK